MLTASLTPFSEIKKKLDALEKKRALYKHKSKMEYIHRIEKALKECTDLYEANLANPTSVFPLFFEVGDYKEVAEWLQAKYVSIGYSVHLYKRGYEFEWLLALASPGTLAADIDFGEYYD